MALVTTRAILLRSHPYSETSQVLRFYTDSMGAVGVMGRGVRAGSGKGGNGLDSFAEGTLSLFVKETRDLQTLKDFVPTRPRRALAADVRRFGGAAVLAEVVLRHAGEEASPPLFAALSAGLDRLVATSGDALIPVVLQEAWHLVGVLGYRPALDECVVCGSDLGQDIGRFDLAAGGLRCARCAAGHQGPRLGPVARGQLRALLDGEPPAVLERPRAHLRLLSDFVTWHLDGGRPLDSLQVLVHLMGDAADAPLEPTRGGPDA